MYKYTIGLLGLLQLVQQFLSENIQLEGSGPDARQSQLYIGWLQVRSLPLVLVSSVSNC